VESVVSHGGRGCHDRGPVEVRQGPGHRGETVGRVATLVGLLGALLGLAWGVVFCFISLASAYLLPGSPGPALHALLAMATPAVALAGSLQATYRPLLAGILLTACGVTVAIIIRSNLQALLCYIVSRPSSLWSGRRRH